MHPPSEGMSRRNVVSGMMAGTPVTENSARDGQYAGAAHALAPWRRFVSLLVDGGNMIELFWYPSSVEIWLVGGGPS